MVYGRDGHMGLVGQILRPATLSPSSTQIQKFRRKSSDILCAINLREMFDHSASKLRIGLCIDDVQAARFELIKDLREQNAVPAVEKQKYKKILEQLLQAMKSCCRKIRKGEDRI